MENGRRSPGRKAHAGKSRVLVLIPIVHTQADMGSLGPELQSAYIEAKGAESWHESRMEILRFWRIVEKEVLSLDLDLSRVRLYQDALPVCGREEDLVRDLAKTGAINYGILLALMQRGATIEGTESLELLLEEYDLLKSGKLGPAYSQDGACNQRFREKADKLLQERDRFIALRIDGTLKLGEIGILFIGALHNVVGFLPETIEIVSLDEMRSMIGNA